MEFLRTDEWLSALDLPRLGEMESFELTGSDVLVTCGGFEDRAFEYLRRAVGQGSKSFSVIAIDYLPFVEANRTDELKSLAAQGNARLSWITYDREDPSDPSQVILGSSEGARRLVIDVSGMSRLLIVQLICSAIRSGRTHGTEIVYTEAEQYAPTRSEVEASLPRADELFGVINFISSGVLGIIVPAELSTVSMYGQPIRLVAFPTFNPAQFAALCAEINASAFTVVHGAPPSAENEWRLDAIRRLNNIDSLREPDEATTSTFDYRGTVKLLVDIYQQHGDREKLVVAPTGSKMQTVAVGLVAGFLRDLQIVYPAPRSFPSPDEYTRGVKRLYGLGLGFLELESQARERPTGTSR